MIHSEVEYLPEGIVVYHGIYEYTFKLNSYTHRWLVKISSISVPADKEVFE